MKVLWAIAAAGLGLMGSVDLAAAQPWDRPGYRERGFDEVEYLRCNPDVRRAVNRGQMVSGLAHWQTFGRREGRRLRC